MSAPKHQWCAAWRDWAGDNLVGPFSSQAKAKEWIKENLREGFGTAVKLTSPESYE